MKPQVNKNKEIKIFALAIRMTDWEWLSIRILILGFTVFLWSYITEIEGIDELFGDEWIKKYETLPARYVWGFRHYVYTTTFALLTIVQIFKIIKWIYLRSKEKDGFEIKNHKGL